VIAKIKVVGSMSGSGHLRPSWPILWESRCPLRAQGDL